MAIMGFNPLWINTALKLLLDFQLHQPGFNPLWINTALKQTDRIQLWLQGFNPLWINTALKLLVWCLGHTQFQSPMD